MGLLRRDAAARIFMSIDIYLLDSANAQMLSRVESDVFDHAIDPRQLQRFLDDPRHVMAFAVSDELVVGMASAVEYYHPDKKPQLWINEVGVAPAHQNRGIGRRLVQALIDEAKNRNCVFAWLGTDSGNKPARACFGSVPGGEEPQAFLLYEWNIPPESANRRPTKKAGR